MKERIMMMNDEIRIVGKTRNGRAKIQALAQLTKLENVDLTGVKCSR